MVYLNELKVSQLKSLAKNLKLTGYSRLAGVGQAVNLLAVSHRVDNGGPISVFGIAESASHCLPDLLRRNIRVQPGSNFRLPEAPHEDHTGVSPRHGLPVSSAEHFPPVDLRELRPNLLKVLAQHCAVIVICERLQEALSCRNS